MIPQHVKIESESFGVQAQSACNIKQKNLAVIQHILSSQLYSNPVLAVLREYTTNASDAHVMSGQAGREVEVTLPTRLMPILKIRDFGIGLSQSEVMDIYVSLGESTKRETNDAMGMLGLGSKSGFSYGSRTFLVVSHFEGVATTYNAFIDEHGIGQIALMGKAETNTTGVEIQIPVKTTDIDLFKSTAFNLFAFFRVKPILKDLSDFDKNTWESTIAQHDASKAVMKGTNFLVFSKVGRMVDSYFIMGDIAYPVGRLSSILTTQNQVLKNFISLVESGGFHINLPIGAIEIAASREAIHFTKNTIENLLKILSVACDEVQAIVAKEFSSCASYFDACIKYAAAVDFSNPIRHLYQGHCKFNGKQLRTELQFNSYGKEYVVVEYTKNSRARRGASLTRVCSREASHIPARKEVRFFEFDLPTPHGVSNRVTELIERQGVKSVFVIKYTGPKGQAEFKSDVPDFDAPCPKLSTLTAYPMSRYYTNAVGTVGSAANHKTGVFKLKANAGYSSYASNYWEPSNVDLQNDSFVYVEIERFFIGGDMRPCTLNSHLKKFYEAGMAQVDVIGIKKSEVAVAKTNPNAVPLKEHLKKGFAVAVATKGKNNIDGFQAYSTLLISNPNIFNWQQNLTRVIDSAMVFKSQKVTNAAKHQKELLTAYNKYVASIQTLRSVAERMIPSDEVLAVANSLKTQNPPIDISNIQKVEAALSHVTRSLTSYVKLDDIVSIVDTIAEAKGL